MKRRLAITILLLATSGALPAQDLSNTTSTCAASASQNESSSLPYFADDVRVHPPRTAGAWVLQIAREGGFSGLRGTELVVDSTGRLTCYSAGADCDEELSAEPVTALGRLIRSAEPSNWTQSVSTICSDCVKTALILRVRGSLGEERAFAACWDGVTREEVPVEAIEIYESIIEGSGPRVK